MKRTLTAAAAVMASSAGAVGFAGTAFAAEAPALPANLPVAGNLTKTAADTANTMSGVQRTVGEVVPVEKALTGQVSSARPMGTARSGEGDGSGGMANGAGANGQPPVTNPVGDLMYGFGGGHSVQETVQKVGAVLPKPGQQPSKAQPGNQRAERSTPDPLSNLVGGVLNSQGLGPGPAGGSPLQGLGGPPPGGSPLGPAAHAVPQRKSGPPLGGLTQPAGQSPATNAAGQLLDGPVKNTLAHGPLGGTANMGG